MAPRQALANADREDAAGRTGSDIALVIALFFIAGHLRELVGAIWLALGASVITGLRALAVALAHAVAMDLVALFGAALVLTVAAGRKRAMGRDFDLACVAFVPYFAVRVVTAILFWRYGTPSVMFARGVRLAGLAWAAVVLFLAWRQARSRPDDAAPSRSTRPPLVALASGGFMLALAGLFTLQAHWVLNHRGLLRPVLPGDQAPGFRLPRMSTDGTLTGEMMSLDQFKGKVVLLDFWANWCRPCRDEIPHIEATYRRFRDRGLQVVSIKTDELDLDQAGPIVARTTFPIVVDSGAIGDAYKVTTIPHLVLIDHKGVVRWVHSGGVSADDLAPKVEQLLDRMPKR